MDKPIVTGGDAEPEDGEAMPSGARSKKQNDNNKNPNQTNNS
jgi:hypothetical protein